MVAVSDVSEWLILGLALGLRMPTLKNITSNHKIEMLTKWLNQVDRCRPSWNTLVKALRSPTVQEYAVANAIAEKYPSLD